MAGDIVADDQFLVGQLELFSLYPAVLKYDMKAFFQLVHIGGGILADDPEEDGQVCMVGRKPFLKIAGLTDLIQVLPCLKDIDTVLTGALFHKMVPGPAD